MELLHNKRTIFLKQVFGGRKALLKKKKHVFAIIKKLVKKNKGLVFGFVR
jgi:hypothetical protein